MNTTRMLLLDADVFIAAKNRYYAFDICPGFWKSLVHHCDTGEIRSIDKVRSELLAGRPTENLAQWVQTELPIDFFLDTSDADITSAYTDIMLWAQRNPQYQDNAKAKFATEADGWLVAYAIASGAIVVTNEQPRPGSRNRILLPDVCAQFGIPYEDTFFMLKHLKIQFQWEAVQ